MRTHPIVAAELQYLGPERLPYSAAFDDVYHARAGALEQARHVFLGGNGLPARWGARSRFVILETGFGLGNNFLATWQAWRDDPRRCDRLYFLSVEKHPLRRDDLRHAHAGGALAPLADQLVAQWPPLTPNIHTLRFEQGRVQLLLALGDVHDLVGQWVAQVDAFFLDGFAPAKNPQMWQPHLFKRMARLAAPEATAATWSTARLVRDGLEGSWEDVFHQCGEARILLMLRGHPEAQVVASGNRLQRAIGVIYRPETERHSHYFMTQLDRQFDAMIHIDETNALRPLDAGLAYVNEEAPETYPSGV